MDVSVLTVTWNSVDYIIKQIESTKLGAGDMKIEQLVADNGSNDGTVAAIRQKFPDLPLVVFNSNRGFAAANNELAKAASGRYFLLLNPDMEVEPESISKLIQFADSRKNAIVVGGALFDSEGKAKNNAWPRRFPGMLDQLVILFKLHHLFPKLLSEYLRADFDITKEQIVDSVQGSFMLVRRSFFEKMGRLFDGRYFIWFEDVDLCREVKLNGGEVWFCPEAKAKDFGGRSFAKQKLFWKQNQLSRSMLKYFMKWEPWYKWLSFAVLRPFVALFAKVYELFQPYES